MLGNPIDFTQFDLVSKLYLISGFKGGSEAHHLINDGTSRPDITFLIVTLFLDLLRAHIVRCANMSLRKNRLIAHDPREAEVTQFYVLVLIKEEVSRLQIAMQNLVSFFASVALKQG
jgi:hypothetical protein